jgi:hypothetical protein
LPPWEYLHYPSPLLAALMSAASMCRSWLGFGRHRRDENPREGRRGGVRAPGRSERDRRDDRTAGAERVIPGAAAVTAKRGAASFTVQPSRGRNHAPPVHPPRPDRSRHWLADGDSDPRARRDARLQAT